MRKTQIKRREEEAKSSSHNPAIEAAEFWERDEAVLMKTPQFGKSDPYQRALMQTSNVVRQLYDLVAFEEEKRRYEALLDELEMDANLGRINALRKLAFMAHEATRRLTHWATQYPEYAEMVAENYTSWPILATNSAAETRRAQGILKRIHLDGAKPITADAANVTYTSTPARDWALVLIQNLELFRSFSPMAAGRGKMSRLRPFVSSERQLSSEEYPEIVEAAKGLPPFNKKSRAAWWKLARQLFARISNAQEWKIEGLANYAKTAKVKAAGGAAGTKRAEIYKQLRQALFALAPE